MSQITVLGPGARRHLVKVTPGKYLSEVRDEACEKLRLDASQYGLKNNNKQVDLTRTFRLSGLPSGAKLDLTQVSRSPSAVFVALQLPETESKNLPSSRLTEKFSSATSLWQILRAFESGKAADTGVIKNFTCRGVPHCASGQSGAGRLWQEMPVLHIMGRDYGTFTDLQKTLAQLGFNDGSVLLKLSFKTTDTPLEEAMQLIEQYFSSSESNKPAGAHAGNVAQAQLTAAQDQPLSIEHIQSPATPEVEPVQSPEASTIPSGESENTPLSSPSAAEPSEAPTALPSVSSRSIAVFNAPKTTIPEAALQRHNETDYEPSVELMKSHQKQIAASTHNKRLPTDAEIAALEELQAQKLNSIKEVSIKIVFPDQTAAESTFSTSDTAATLYEHVRSCLARRQEPFSLKYNSAKGFQPMKESSEKLIGDLKLTGRVLVRVLWAEGASLAARQSPSLREDLAAQGKDVEVKDFGGGKEEASANQGSKTPERNLEKKEKGKGGIPKWLKLPGKK